MQNWPILSLATFLPLFGAGLILLLARGGTVDEQARAARWIALWTTLVNLAVAAVIWVEFDNGNPGFQFVEHASWLTKGIDYHMGVDGISMLFVVLTAFLMSFFIIAAWEAIHTRVPEYMIAFLIMESMMVGVFCALDFVLFYLFFEGGLIPMFLIIGVWGGPRRIYATFKFFLFTLAGSVLLLLAMIYMYLQAGTTDIPTLIATKFGRDVQIWLWLAFFASFAVKVPMWPVHTWLPDAHVEAPTAGSVILAGVLLKIGGYGFLRFSIPMLPHATEVLGPLVFALSVVAIIYTGLVALMQEDMKKLIAYSSVAHMGFVTAGMFALTQQGIEGSILQMLSHGLVSGALFLCVGVVYDRLHTREIARYGGLARNMPIFAFCFMIFTLANVGLPGTSGFVGEFLILVGIFQKNTWVALLCTTGIIIGAAYALWLYRKVVFGELTKSDLKELLDMNKREIAVFTPLVVGTFAMGIYPAPFLDVMHAAVGNLIKQHHAAIEAATLLAAR